MGFTLDGRAVTGGSDGDIKLWSSRRKRARKLPGHKARVSALAVSPMDGTIASGDWSGEVRLWDGKHRCSAAHARREGSASPRAPHQPKWEMAAVALAGESWRQGLWRRVWELATGKEVHTYAGHDNTVFAVAISPDSRHAATAGGSRFAIHVWDLETGARSKAPDGKAFDTRRDRRAALGRWLLGGWAKPCVGTELDEGEAPRVPIAPASRWPQPRPHRSR